MGKFVFNDGLLSTIVSLARHDPNVDESVSKLTRDKNPSNLREDWSNEEGKYLHIYYL